MIQDEQLESATHPGLLDLPTELILSILREVPNPTLQDCTRVSHLFNRLAVSVLLEKEGIRDPAQLCRLRLYTNPKRNTDINPLSALLASTTLQRFKHLTVQLSRTQHWPSALTDGVRTLRQLHRLLMKLSSIDDFSLTLNILGTRPLDDAELKRSAAVLQDLLNAAVEKSCQGLKIANIGLPFSRCYAFSESSGKDNPSGLLKTLRKRLKRRSISDAVKDNNNAMDSDAGRYERVGGRERVFFSCSPAALQNTKVRRLTIGTADMLFPPCSNWTFPMMKHSPITTFTLTLNWKGPLEKKVSEAEFSLTFARLVDSLPEISGLYLIDASVPTILSALPWINQFGLLINLQFFIRSGSKIDERLTKSLDSFSLDLPDLHWLYGPHEIITFIFSHPVKLPRLRSVCLSFSYKTVGCPLDVLSIAEILGSLRRRVQQSHPLVTFFVEIEFDSNFFGIHPSLINGIRPELTEWEEELATLSRLTIVVPGPSMMTERFYPRILGCLTLFPGLTRLGLQTAPRLVELYPPLVIKRWILDGIKRRCPTLVDIHAYEEINLLPVPKEGA